MTKPDPTSAPAHGSTAIRSLVAEAADQQGLANLAFRYIAGELADDELLGFEELLARDQQAREAVASAVELTQAIAFVESVTDLALPTHADVSAVARNSAVAPNSDLGCPAEHSSFASTGSRRRELATVVAVVSLVVAATLLLVLQQPDSVVPDALSPRESVADRQLAMLWNETRESTSWDALTQNSAEAAIESSEDRTASHRLAQGTDADDASAVNRDEAWEDPMQSPMGNTPSWMLAAVEETDGAAGRPSTRENGPTSTGNEE